ncbi:MAG: hypothetical protein EVA70_01355 [Parvularculaceae bacterium]|nr:MAG: hypothetical protein EVA70_01355 [Parvularculaceae bacterium]
MGSRGRQLLLALPAKPARLGRATYGLSSANIVDLETLDAWQRSEEFLLTICGPARSGKTHLASILAEDLAGDVFILKAAAEGFRALENLPPLVIVDDLDADAAPRAILETIERARHSSSRLVLVGRGNPVDWAGGLKDLVTRLEAAPRLRVSTPDEALLKAVLAKVFIDRELAVRDDVLALAASRLPRRLNAAISFAEALDRAALERRAEVTIALAKQILSRLFPEE